MNKKLKSYEVSKEKWSKIRKMKKNMICNSIIHEKKHGLQFEKNVFSLPLFKGWSFSFAFPRMICKA
jgi:hypothetical protein